MNMGISEHIKGIITGLFEVDSMLRIHSTFYFYRIDV